MVCGLVCKQSTLQRGLDHPVTSFLEPELCQYCLQASRFQRQYSAPISAEGSKTRHLPYRVGSRGLSTRSAGARRRLVTASGPGGRTNARAATDCSAKLPGAELFAADRASTVLRM